MYLYTNTKIKERKIKKMNSVEVTEVRVKKINSNLRAKAIASVVLNGSIKICDIRVIDNTDKNKGLMIAMPSRKLENGEFKDLVHPINHAVREKITKAILEEYNKQI